MTKNQKQVWSYTGLILLLIALTIIMVKGNPVRIHHTSNSVNIDGKTMARDIFKELSPEIEAPIFASFEFGLGDRSSKSHEKRYSHAAIRGRGHHHHSHSSSASSSSEEHRRRYRNEYRFGFPRFF